MNISKYTAFFHDGELIDIKHFGNGIEFVMESAEVCEEDIGENIKTSKNNTICGKLHVREIKHILINGIGFLGVLNKPSCNVELFRFKLNGNLVEFQFIYEKYLLNPKMNEFSVIQIEAEKIWWENIPNLIET